MENINKKIGDKCKCGWILKESDLTEAGCFSCMMIESKLEICKSEIKDELAIKVLYALDWSLESDDDEVYIVDDKGKFMEDVTIERFKLIVDKTKESLN